MEYTSFTSMVGYMLDGIYLLKNNMYVLVVNRAFYGSFQGVFPVLKDTPAVDSAQPVIGISEDTMLCAIAIAQDPKLATTLLAMRQTSRN